MTNPTDNELLRGALACRKPSKQDAQATIRQLADQYPDAVPYLASLYAFFMPPRGKSPKTAFQWVALAAGKQDERAYLNWVYVTEEHLTATNGHRLHRAPNADNLAPGYYHPATGERAYPLGKWPYPDVSRVIPKPAAQDPVDLDGCETIEVGIAGPCYMVQEVALRVPYLREALAGMPAARIQTDGPLNPVRLDDGGRLAVIMPVRI